MAAVAGACGIIGFALIEWSSVESPARLQSQAEAAAKAGDWAAARRYWAAINATSAAGSHSRLGEARACLALGRAAEAETSLDRAIKADPSDVELWLLLLQILRVEDRTLEAQHLGWKAYDQVRPESRRALLRELTLGFLADLPDDLVRNTLRRWVDADSTDINAQIALWQRITTQPGAADPDRPAILNAVEAILANHPEHVAAREVLVSALADAGEPERGHIILDQWPESNRDARYWRLRGRWELEYDHDPAGAAHAFQTALEDVPQDWRTWYRLARALHTLKRDGESRKAAETVSRIREVLDPFVLGPRLDAAFARLDDPAALRDLATLCGRAGLTRLANAWLTEARPDARAAPAHSRLDPDSADSTSTLERLMSMSSSPP